MVGSDILLTALLALNPVADVGTLKDTDDPVPAIYRCTNQSEDTIHITRINTSCGCTIPNGYTKEIAPGDTAEISLTFNPHNQIGTIDVQAFVYYKTPESEEQHQTLRITGNVLEASPYSHYRVAMGELRLRTAAVKLTGKTPQIERIACANISDKPLKLKPLLCPEGVTISSEPSVIPPGAEADIIITISKSPRLTPANIIIDGLNCPPSQRTITLSR